MYCKVRLKSPGIVVQLPHNDMIIRTPYEYVMDVRYQSAVLAMIRVRGISDFQIEEISDEEAQEELKKLVPSKVKRQSTEKKVRSSEISTNLKIGGDKH